ncbi:MAG: nuclear transport factor 2 family protein [Frankiales bacterium]|nr:MAG: nuclear transport factor 2 family protein [Frankiales bacterium]
MDTSERAIEHLLYTYADRIDRGDLDGVADLFAHGRIRGAADGPLFEGRDGVRAMFETRVRIYDDGTPKTQHLTTNARIEVDEDAGTARSRACYSVTQATPDLPLQVIVTGRYDDTFHRVGDRWAFDTRVMHVDQVGDVSHHLKRLRR